MKEFDSTAYTTSGASTASLQRNVFSDIPTNFEFHPGTKDLARVLDEEAIKQSLKNILKTNRYERLYNPLFGSNLNAMLFEQLDDRNLDDVDILIRTAIENFEPRVALIDVVVSGLVDDNTVAVTLFYSTLNNPVEQRLDVTITRVR
jgi:phage baseplate assembly protein W